MTDAEGRLANLGESSRITISGNTVLIGSFSFLMPIRITSTGFLRFNGRSYRGSFLITQRGGLLNAVDIEQYLCGVLPAEVGATWPEQALRAQAISARTYVIRQSLNRAKKGYDVVDTDADQVYKGAEVETEKTNRAVMSTASEILTYGKRLRRHSFTRTAADTLQTLPTFGGVLYRTCRESRKSSTTSLQSRRGQQKYLPQLSGTL